MRWSLVFFIVLAALGVAAWQAETRAELALRLLLRSTVVQLAPYGELSYGATGAHFWHRGWVEDLRFVPAPALRAALDWRGDDPLHLPLLRYRGWQQDTPWPRAIDLDFEAAQLPFETPWPRQADGHFVWRYQADHRELQLRTHLDAAGAATLDGDLRLKVAEAGRWRGAALLGMTIDYRDRGLAQAKRAALALQAGADPASGDAAFAARLLDWLARQGLPADDAMQKALRDFAAQPVRLRVVLDPPGELRPETLRQFAAADRAAALGLSLETR